MGNNLNNKQELLEKAQLWFSETIVKNHIKNTKKLVNPKEFNLNPFLLPYLSNFLTGNSSAKSIAKALILPRVLGTSITGSFGSNIQKFVTDVLGAYGSTTSGIDIEFNDHVDGMKKYCQMKLGPNTINKDDVPTVHQHLQGAKRLSIQNNLKVPTENFIVGVVYGTKEQLSYHYKRLESEHLHPIFVGQDLWHRITGDETFYDNLLAAIASVAVESDFKEELESVIDQLAATEEIQKISNQLKP